jgi:hypothetical protein
VALGGNASTGLTAFTVTNNGTGSTVTITIGGSNMTGGSTPWTLSSSATAGANQYYLEAGVSGGSYNILVKPSAAYNVLVSTLANNATLQWGMMFFAPTSETDVTAKTATITLTGSVP